jgi:hypothetical protein
LAASILFVFGSLFGISGILLPRSQENESGFADGIRRLPENMVYLRLFAIAVVSSLATFARRPAVRFVLQVAVFAAVLLFVNHQLRPSSQLALGYAMFQRAQVHCALAVAVVLVLIRGFFVSDAKWLKSFHAGILIPPLIGVLVIDTVDTVRWIGFIGRFCKEMTVGNAASHSAFFAEGPTRRYGINWAFPTMSVVLGGRNNRTTLAEPEYSGWQPFDPRHPPDIRVFKTGETICP